MRPSQLPIPPPNRSKTHSSMRPRGSQPCLLRCIAITAEITRWLLPRRSAPKIGEGAVLNAAAPRRAQHHHSFTAKPGQSDLQHTHSTTTTTTSHNCGHANDDDATHPPTPGTRYRAVPSVETPFVPAALSGTSW